MNYGRAKSHIHQHKAAQASLAEAKRTHQEAMEKYKAGRAEPFRLRAEAQMKDGMVATLEKQMAALVAQSAKLKQESIALREQAKKLDDVDDCVSAPAAAVRRAQLHLDRFKDVEAAQAIVDEVESFEKKLLASVTESTDLLLKSVPTVPREVLLQGLTYETFIKEQVKVKRREAQAAAGKRFASKPQKVFNAQTMGNKTI